MEEKDLELETTEEEEVEEVEEVVEEPEAEVVE